MAKVTLNLNQDENHIKTMIQELKVFNSDSNKYYKRSESEIAKMILEPVLKRIYNNILKRK